MAEPTDTSKTAALIYEEGSSAAPLVYFDIVGAHGIMNGTVQIELAARVLHPLPDGSVEIKFVSCGRLRCNAVAAANLRGAIDAALKMTESPQEVPAGESPRLN